MKWCESAKKFAACGMSTRQSGKMLVYILNYLIKNAWIWGAIFIRYMCMLRLNCMLSNFESIEFAIYGQKVVEERRFLYVSNRYEEGVMFAKVANYPKH